MIYANAIAFSLYGSNPKYTEGMLSNVVLARAFFPSWEVVVFFDRSVPDAIISRLIKMGVKMHDCSRDRAGGMFWRYRINDMARCWIVRDADSRIGFRDYVAVHQWVEDRTRWHSVIDVPHRRKVYGGCIGGRRTKFNMRRAIRRWIRNGNSTTEYGDDEDFLEAYVLPEMRTSLTEHHYETRPIKAPMGPINYLGRAFDQFEQPIDKGPLA